jgi:hypothetical protein
MFLVICGLDGDAHFLIGRRGEGRSRRYRGGINRFVASLVVVLAS